MLVLSLLHVLSRFSGFVVVSPCLWGRRLWCHFAWQVRHFVTFWRVSSAIFLRGFQKIRCIFRGRRGHPHSTICTVHSELYTPQFTLHCWHATSAIQTLHFTLCTLHSALYITIHTCTPHYTLDFTLYTLHFTLRTLHSTLYISHFTLHTLHCIHLPRLHFTLHTAHFTLHSYFTLYTSHFTLRTLHFTLHSTLSPFHSTPYTPHFTLCTLHSPLNTSTLQTLHSTPLMLHGLHWYGHRGKICNTVKITCLYLFHKKTWLHSGSLVGLDSTIISFVFHGINQFATSL